jgi:hypothetical protein
VIIKKLPVIYNELNISTVLDIPCVDFHWMKTVDMKNIDYIGADIVEQLIHHNKEKYEKEYLHFRKLDITKDRLPKVDLIFCRDCLVHLSFRDIFMALYNICSSESKYLLTTTFPGRKDNCDILTGERCH